MRLSVAAKIALYKAGAIDRVPGSPTPPGGMSYVCGKVCTRMSRGALKARSTSYSWKLPCSALSFVKVIFTGSRQAQAHDDAYPFDLRENPVRCDLRTAIDRYVGARNADLAVIVSPLLCTILAGLRAASCRVALNAAES